MSLKIQVVVFRVVHVLLVTEQNPIQQTSK